MSSNRTEKLSRYHSARYGDRTVVPLNASARLRAEIFARWVGRGKRLLELGAGSGALLARYAEGNRVTAMDVDEPALEACRQRLGVETVWGDFALALPFPDGAFDAVVAGETLEHVPYPPIFLDEIRRVLVPEGMFVGSVPNAYRYRNRIDVLIGRPIDTDPTHVRFFSLDLLRATLGRHFFVAEIVAVRGRWAHRWPSLFAHKFAWRAVRRD
jgi:SAM-dependent methyltransferase